MIANGQLAHDSEVVVIDVELARLLGTVCAHLDSGLLVVTDSLLEEVGLSLEGNHVHPFKWIFDVPLLWDSQAKEQTVSNKLDVLRHQTRVHTDQLNGERLGHKVSLDLDGLADDLQDAFVRQFVIKVLVQQAGKISVHALVTRDQFVGEGQARHETTLFEPEDRAEAARKENSFDGSKGNQALGKAIA